MDDRLSKSLKNQDDLGACHKYFYPLVCPVYPNRFLRFFRIPEYQSIYHGPQVLPALIGEPLQNREKIE